MFSAANRTLGGLLVLTLGTTWALVSRSDDAAAPAGDAAREAVVRIARGYKLFLGPGRRPLEMQPEPVLRWPNPTRDPATGEGENLPLGDGSQEHLDGSRPVWIEDARRRNPRLGHS